MSDLGVKRVNGYWIEQFLSMCGWHLDADNHLLNRLNMENENSRAQLVEDYLKPAWQELSYKQRIMVKESLRYALNFFDTDEWETFSKDVLPDISRSPIEFFTDLWGRLFPGEPWHLSSNAGYVRLHEFKPSIFDTHFK